LAIGEAREVWRSQGADLVVTSVIDGTHKRGSAHYAGRAVDLRVHNLQDPAKARSELAQALGQDFDCILEAAGTPGAHLHLEFQAKQPY